MSSYFSLSEMFDVGDLPVLTFGNWVLKAEWLSGLWNYMYVFYVFYVFFSKSKENMTFYVFWVVAHVFPNSDFNCISFAIRLSGRKVAIKLMIDWLTKYKEKAEAIVLYCL